MTTTHTATLLAWCHDDAYAMRRIGSDDPAEAVGAAVFHMPHDAEQDRIDSWAKQGYMLIGKAEITLHLNAPETLAAAQIDTLRAKKQAVLAEAQNKATQIERQIQTLLAIAA